MNSDILIKTLGLGLSIIVSACAQIDRAAIDSRIKRVEHDIAAEWQVVGIPKTVRSKNWQSLFEDQLLAEFLAEAELENFDIRQAITNLTSARRSINEARSALLPKVDVSVGVSGAALLQNLETINDRSDSSLSLLWDPDLFGSNRANLRQAKASFRAQQAVSSDVRQQVLASVARLYVIIVQAELQLELASSNLGFLRDRFRISQAQFEVGSIGRDDLAFAETNFQSSLASFQNQELATRQTRRALSVLLGGFGEADLVVAEKLPQAIDLPQNGIPAVTLQQRPDVQLAWAQIEVAIASYEVTVADDWPTLSLSGTLGGGGLDIGDIFEPSNYLASLASNIAGNIFDGGMNKAQRDIAKLNLESALLNYEEVLREAKAEIENLYDQDAVSKGSLAALRDASSAGNLALRMEQIRFELGDSDLLSVLQVQQTVNSVNAARIDAEASLLLNQIDAYLATGGDLFDVSGDIANNAESDLWR